jgi:hypothetical protein
LNYEKPPRYPQKEKYKKSNLKSPRRNTFDKSKNQWIVGNFILDTGASNSCVGLKALPYFNFKQKIQNKSIWAGATGMQTQIASIMSLDFGNI